MIWAYPDELTVSRQLVLHVSTKAPAFRVDAYRQGVELEFVGCFGNGFSGLDLPFGGATAPWAWPSFVFEIDPTWRPGVYVAVLTPLDIGGRQIQAPDPADLAATWGKALFIVNREQKRSDPLQAADIHLPCLQWHGLWKSLRRSGLEPA